jgi:hypothetical protein
LEVKEAPTVFGAKAKTFFLRLDDVLGFTVVFCIELDVFVGSALVLKALTRETERLQELVVLPPMESSSGGHLLRRGDRGIDFDGGGHDSSTLNI